MEKECTRRIMKGSQKQLRVLNVLRKLWVGTKANLERQEQEVQPLSFYQDCLAVMPMAVNTALLGPHCHWLLLPQGTRVTGNHSGRHEWSVSTSLSLCHSRHSQSWVEAESQSHTACWLLVFIEWEGSPRKRVQTLCRRLVHFSSANCSLRPLTCSVEVILSKLCAVPFFVLLHPLGPPVPRLIVRIGESEHPCFLPHQREALSLSPLSPVSPVGFSQRLLIKLKIFLFLSDSFDYKWMLNLVKCFFCVYWEDGICCSVFDNMMKLYQFFNVGQILNYLVMMYYPFYTWILLNSIC